MLAENRIVRASDMLWALWQEGGRVAALPDDLRPATRAEGYAIQARLEAHSGRPLFGWKIAATSRDGQAHIGVDGPIAGRLLAERAYDGGAVLPFGANYMRVAEAEFAFRFGRDLAPRVEAYGVDEVLAAVAGLHPAIEVPDSRYDDFASVGAPQLIADNACANDFVLGPPAPALWREVDLVRHQVTGTVAGKLSRQGRGGNVLGDPRLALMWLVNELSGLGITLAAGEVVTTGTCLDPMPVEPGDRVTADFGGLGMASASFAPA